MSRCDRFAGIGQQRDIVTNDFELDQIRLEGLSRQFCRLHRFGRREATRGIGQESEIKFFH